MDRKKEDIDSRLKEIQRLLKQNVSVDDGPTQEPLKPTKKHQHEHPKHTEVKPDRHQQTSIREELSEIKSLLMMQLDGQRRLESSVAQLKRYMIGSMASARSGQQHGISHATYQSKGSSGQPRDELSDFDNLQGNRYY